LMQQLGIVPETAGATA